MGKASEEENNLIKYALFLFLVFTEDILSDQCKITRW